MTTETKGYIPKRPARGTSSKKKPAKGWSAERRARQAENIRKTRPWDKATGPKTAEGKAVSKNNGYKHGWRSEDIRAVYRLLRLQRRMLREFTLRHCEEAEGRRGNPATGLLDCFVAAAFRNDVRRGEKTP